MVDETITKIKAQELQNVETNPYMPWKVWIVGDYAFATYHTSYQTPGWNHPTQWCQLLPNIDEGPLVAPYISSMSHNNGGVTNLGEILVLEFEESPLNDDVGGVGV